MDVQRSEKWKTDRDRSRLRLHKAAVLASHFSLGALNSVPSAAPLMPVTGPGDHGCVWPTQYVIAIFPLPDC